MEIKLLARPNYFFNHELNRNPMVQFSPLWHSMLSFNPLSIITACLFLYKAIDENVSVVLAVRSAPVRMN